MIETATARGADLAEHDGPRLYYLHPLQAGPLHAWAPHLARAAALGFSHVLIAPPFQPAPHGSLFLSATHEALHDALGWAGDADSGLVEIARLARAAGLRLLLDVVLDRVADASPLATQPATPFTRPDRTLDPTRFDPDGDAARAGTDEAGLALLVAFWRARLAHWAGLGVAGFRLLGLPALPPAGLGAIAAGLSGTGARLFGWMPGVALPDLPAFEGSGLDYVFNSLPWWDGTGDWLWREWAALRRIAPVVTAAETPFGPRRAQAAHGPAAAIARQRGQTLAALLGSGWMLTMGAEYAARHSLDAARDTPLQFEALQADPEQDSTALVAGLNAERARFRLLSANGAPALLTGAGAPVLAVARPAGASLRVSPDAAIVLVNMRAEPEIFDAASAASLAAGYFTPPTPRLSLPPGGHEILALQRLPSWPRLPAMLDDGAKRAARQGRIAIENISPAIDGGAHPVRVIAGERVVVEADLICDGHEILAAELRWADPATSAEPWHTAPMHPIGNDRWRGAFIPHRMGRHHFTIVAWRDVFGSFREELRKKHEAGLHVTLEAEEGRLLVAAAAARTARADLATLLATLDAADTAQRVALLLDPATAALMAAVDARAFCTESDPPVPLHAERAAARFAAWYELFPRSMRNDGVTHGTFDDVIAQLPRIARLGFDVLYFPPIHPIGRVNRKGRNNALEAEPDDPGSPYGIADHLALHPQLGTFADFARLIEAAAANGLEIALDFAVQCAPDHVWLRENPEWFARRPDGSIRYAENPPKKYQDIVNVDYYATAAIPALWRTLAEVVLFWCDKGVRIFRVDNPHTKPLPFWQWLIETVQSAYPDALFLAEAFTRPKMMLRLAKIGFSQSYTYFTWRNTKAELTDYLTELTQTAARHYFRPHFFVNTPDINPPYLQDGGRAAHLVRAALAATLSGLWGVYCGFELCVATPLPGREEYLDSEKYQLRAWNFGGEGNIEATIARLNAARRLNPALQSHLGVTFLEARNPQILFYEKANADRSNVLLVAVNLDPHAAHEAEIDLPLWRFGLPDTAALAVEDLLADTRFTLHGKSQRLRLDPAHTPFVLWRVHPA